MSRPTTYLDAQEVRRVELRAAVAAVDAFITHLPRTHSGPDRGLQAAWGSLVALLALGATSQQRTCPCCGRSCARAATRCGHCWAPLDLSEPSPDDPPAADFGGES